MNDLQEWLRERWLLLLAGLLAVLLGGVWWRGRPVVQPAGILVAEEPLQGEPEPTAPWAFKHHRITPLASFELRARVLGTERYRFDRAAELSPVDLALGWGPMSDSRNLAAISIQQRDRWYFWSASRMPLDPAGVTTHSANMHMIPATGAIASRLLAVRVGQLVELRGQLIRADGEDGWRWASSLSRADTGDGSCEVVWVESLRVTDR